ncbi:MAG: Na+/H+ antiporter [Actinomycetota bacterium]|nr:Na+/H+ antiporter [Actinomycetota bacterium]
MQTAIGLIAFLAALVAIGELARRAGMPAPLLLVIVGIGASFLPVVGPVRITPDLILVGLLPPLLYAAAVRTSLVDFRANLRPIGLLSVGLVLFNTVCIGLLAWVLLPIPLAAAMALGAVVAPPDAVAATAIARRVGMPRRVVTILEGESLINDATALVCLRAAIAALAGTLSVGGVIASFAQSVVGGLVVGVLVAMAIGFVRRKVLDIFTDITISFLTPFLSYVLAEEIHASGFLAVVVTGLLLGHKAPRLLTAQSRVLEQANWATVQFVLENAVFLLIGLQASTIVDDLAQSELGLGQLLLIALVILGAVILLRIVWVFPVTYISRLVPGEGRGDRAPSWRIPALISWAGMRGVVTLAAVFVLPPETPEREALILVALVVTAGTLLLQGSTLPWLVRRLRLAGPDPAEDTLAEAALFQRAARQGLVELDKWLTGDEPPDVVDRLRRRGLDRADAVWERLGATGETPSAIYARLRGQMIDAERAEVLRARDSGEVPDEVLRSVLSALDVEETVLDRAAEMNTADRPHDLTAATSDACAHLKDAPAPSRPAAPPDGCEACLAVGRTDWVHLRLCLTCGHVGCCDSSPLSHAQGHYTQVQHPVMRSAERGEAWRWCYVDEVLG